jgi:hypothetical protein
MNEMWLNAKDFYWEHRDVARVALSGAVMVVTQLVIVLWTLGRLRELAHIRERMSRLADGLALLTDTTEAGLSTLIKEVEGLSRRAGAVSQPAAARAQVARRVTSAARKGDKVARIAEREALSESEVRLHLALSENATGRRAEPVEAVSGQAS